MGVSCFAIVLSKVHIFQSWVKWLRQHAFEHEEVIVVNMDESAVQHEYHAVAGNAITFGRRECAEMRWCEDKVKRSNTRAHCTLAGFICNREDLQKHMPQVFLPSSKNRPLSRAEQAAFDALEPPLVCWTGTGGWVNADLMKRLLTALRASIRRVAAGAKILLWMDAASQHVSVDVLNHAARLQIYLLLVPASLTWLCQPLDVYVFARLKAAFRDRHRLHRKTSPTGQLAPAEWIQVTARVVKQVLVDTSWHETFSKLGVWEAHAEPNRRWGAYAKPAAEVIPKAPNDDEIEMLVGRHRLDLARRFVDGPLRVRAGRVAAAAADGDAHLHDIAAPAPAVPRAVRLMPPAAPLPPPDTSDE